MFYLANLWTKLMKMGTLQIYKNDKGKIIIFIAYIEHNKSYNNLSLWNILYPDEGKSLMFFKYLNKKRNKVVYLPMIYLVNLMFLGPSKHSFYFSVHIKSNAFEIWFSWSSLSTRCRCMSIPHEKCMWSRAVGCCRRVQKQWVGEENVFEAFGKLCSAMTCLHQHS